jgi:hypothetical protein
MIADSHIEKRNYSHGILNFEINLIKHNTPRRNFVVTFITACFSVPF